MDQPLLQHQELTQPTEPEKLVTGQPATQWTPCAMGAANPPSLKVLRTYKTKKLMNYNSCQSRRLGILQLVFGSIGLVLNIVGIVLSAVGRKYRERWNNASSYSRNNNNMNIFYDNPDRLPYYISSGLWGGMFFVISGSLALVAAKRKTKCVITSNLVFSIFASVCALGMLGMAIWALVSDADRIARGFHYEIWPRNNRYNNYNHNYNHNYDQPYLWTTMPSTTTEAPIEVYAGHYAVLKLARLALSGVFVLVSVIQFIVSVRNAYICGRVLCCSASESTDTQDEEVVSLVNGGYAEHDTEQGQTNKPGVLTGQSSSVAKLAGQGHCGLACFWNPDLCSDICTKCKGLGGNSTQWVVLDQNGQAVDGATVIRMSSGNKGSGNGVLIAQTGALNPGMIQSA